MTCCCIFFFEQCRQAKITYAGKFTADVCFQYNNGPVIRENLNFGQFPIMLQVRCFVFFHLLFLKILAFENACISIVKSHDTRSKYSILT